jgi:hypothetical protein
MKKLKQLNILCLSTLSIIDISIVDLLSDKTKEILESNQFSFSFPASNISETKA